MAGKLTARSVSITRPGQYSDGAGLYLIVSDTGARKWVFRFSFRGRVKMMGLGSADVITLAEARALRDEARRKVAFGQNPIEVRRAERRQGKTFGDFAEGVITKQAAQSKNEKHKLQWRNTLEHYAKSLWDRPVNEIETSDILAVLTPIWSKIPETASRVRGRIEKVLDSARALGAIPADKANPARWRGHLALLLPRQDKLTRGNQPALAYSEMPEFMQALRGREATAALALEFQILTAARPGEATGAQWSEINLNDGIWTIPPEMHKTGKKTGKPHVVPLGKRAVLILKMLSGISNQGFVFLGNNGQPLSDMAASMLLRRMNSGERKWIDRVQEKNIVPHGFRSSFRDWAGDETHFQREIIEQALSHVIGGVEGAYRRSDALEKRRELMQAWENFCYPAEICNVVSANHLKVV